MSTKEKSVNEETLIVHQKKQGIPELENIAALIKREGDLSGEVNIHDLDRPETGGSAGSYAFAADFDDGSGYKSHNLFIRFLPFCDPVFKGYNLPGQFQIMKALGSTDIPVPNVLYLDGTGDILGTPGFIMNKIEGKVPPEYYARGVLADATPENRRAMVLDVVGTLAKLHSLDWSTLGVDFLNERCHGNTYIEREVNWYWENINWGWPEKAGILQEGYQWLIDNQPKDCEISLCHGDANFSNYMFRDNHVVGVFDWEFAFLGPAEFDLAFLMSATQVMTQGQTRPAGFPSPEECKQHYQDVRGKELRHWEYAVKKANFMIAVNLWMGFRIQTVELQQKFEPMVVYCLDRLYDRVPLSV